MDLTIQMLTVRAMKGGAGYTAGYFEYSDYPDENNKRQGPLDG